MIVDAILLDNELDCLEIRLRELEGLIDRLVIVQGNLTHQGEPREIEPESLLWTLADSFGVELRHVVADLRELAPESNLDASNTRAIMQRNAILQGLDGVGPDDMVMISDVDEIPRRQSFEDAISWLNRTEVAAFEMDQFYFRLNLRDTCERFFGPRLIRRSVLTYPHNFRVHFERAGEVVMRHGGWHFGWLGDTDHQLRKIRNFSHPELNTPEVCNREFLETCLRTRMTAHNGHILERLDLDDSFPILVKEKPENYVRLMA